MENKRILIVDDEPEMRLTMMDILEEEGIVFDETGTGTEAIDMACRTKYNLILLDINLPGYSGLEVLKNIKAKQIDVPVIVFTAFGTPERAIEAMKNGAFDYLEKPFELSEFFSVVREALDFSKLATEILITGNSAKVELLSPKPGLTLIGKNQKMQEIFKLIGVVSQSDATVLIQGDSGTGKEMIADAIQKYSSRNNRPYIKVNCGALSETILESEIFGHEKGSFTGALAQKKGRFELADGGTIFLDEINNMPSSLQVRLLRILQNQAFYRVGGEMPLKVNVRVIAASNVDIEKEVESGKFRKDLFYRLNVVRINIPPLRERSDDIPMLAKYFVRKYSPSKQLEIPPSIMEKLVNYDWPGNVRELENTIQRAAVISRENILNIKDMNEEIRKAQPKFDYDSVFRDGLSLRNYVALIEKKLILKALEISGDNKSKAAKILKMNRRLLYSKLKEYSIS
ncbi:MAG: sigma-54 dependent transcriptional regulator [Ignavibacteriales bacterium]|nr:sigma-54 dependent transcriptional regulator [Ignavibacteriales bacterium]